VISDGTDVKVTAPNTVEANKAIAVKDLANMLKRYCSWNVNECVVVK
jgi:hypothetical protein